LTTSSNTSDSKLREYGLEFIKDLAKDRKLAIQALGVSFSGFKTDLLNRSNIITRHEDRLQVESYLKSLDEDVNRTIESQLTRITIKSFNWIKNVMIQDERIVIENKDELLIEELQGRLKKHEGELSRLKHTSQSLNEQLEKRKKELLESEQRFKEYQNEIQEQIVSEKSSSQNLTIQLEEVNNKLSEKEAHLNAKIVQNKELEEKNASLDMKLIEKSAEITRLNSSLDSQAADAMETWASAYSEQQQEYQQELKERQEILAKQEEQFQITLKSVKQEYEESSQNRLRENTQKFQVELHSLEEKISEEELKREEESKEHQTRIAELTSQKELIENRAAVLDTQISELLKNNDDLTKEVTSGKIKLDEISMELDEVKKREVENQAVKETTRTLVKVRNINEYIEQVLSLSNYSPITILVRMGQMNLDALAQSVGMDPIVLENQLQPLNNRDLIDIKSDGTIIANIPQ
jgi:chromosome segregation ATPase